MFEDIDENNLKFVLTHQFVANFHDNFNQLENASCPEKDFIITAITVMRRHKLDELLIIPDCLAELIEKAYPKHDVPKTTIIDCCCKKKASKGSYPLEEAISLANELPDTVLIITDSPSDKEKAELAGQKTISSADALSLIKRIKEKLDNKMGYSGKF